MKVDIFTLDPKTADDKLVGSFSLDNGHVRAHPAGAGERAFLTSLFDTPVYDHETGSEIDRDGDPGAWLSALHTNYHSPYLRATDPNQPRDGDDEVRD